MDEEKQKEIDPYINCILCGICFGVCPAFGRDSRYLGPAMLAKAYRFLIDPRDKRSEEILKTADRQTGVWGCNTVFNCVKVCPKEVPPTHAILGLRKKILKYRLASIFPFLSLRLK
jgi:succinate dehydrogenase / fumarate reductase iron-sulfur subunit